MRSGPFFNVNWTWPVDLEHTYVKRATAIVMAVRPVLLSLAIQRDVGGRRRRGRGSLFVCCSCPPSSSISCPSFACVCRGSRGCCVLKTRTQISEILLLLENFCGYFIFEEGNVSFCRCCFLGFFFLGRSEHFVFSL